STDIAKAIDKHAGAFSFTALLTSDPVLICPCIKLKKLVKATYKDVARRKHENRETKECKWKLKRQSYELTEKLQLKELPEQLLFVTRRNYKVFINYLTNKHNLMVQYLLTLVDVFCDDFGASYRKVLARM
ncbi:hypothetical protein C0J52_26552, partial [Blattella germanica]